MQKSKRGRPFCRLRYLVFMVFFAAFGISLLGYGLLGLSIITILIICLPRLLCECLIALIRRSWELDPNLMAIMRLSTDTGSITCITWLIFLFTQPSKPWALIFLGFILGIFTTICAMLWKQLWQAEIVSWSKQVMWRKTSYNTVVTQELYIADHPSP